MATGKKTGGRQKGQPNKTTKEIRECFQSLVEMNLENMNTWLNKVAKQNPEKAMHLIIGLSEYVLPKLARTENTNINEKQKFIVTIKKPEIK